MKKGRHRRYQEVRDLKRGGLVAAPRELEECAECQRTPHAEWCMAEEFMEEEDSD
jgi:hypothetical protein